MMEKMTSSHFNEKISGTKLVALNRTEVSQPIVLLSVVGCSGDSRGG